MVQFDINFFNNNSDFPFFIQYGFHNESLFLHGHKNFSEIVIVLDGKAEHIVDNQYYPISKGDVFVISNDTEHGYTRAENFRICNIMFAPSLLSEAELDITASPGFQALFVLEPCSAKLSRFNSRLKLDMDSFSQVYGIVNYIIKEYNEKEAGWKTAVKSGFYRLVVTLSRLYSFDSPSASSESLVRLANAVAFIEQNYSESFTVSELAKLSNYSERQFIRLFKEAFNCIPSAYITKLRMQKARELLRTTDFTVTEIAVRSGYNDVNYFSRVFRKINGTTPTEFRSVF